LTAIAAGLNPFWFRLGNLCLHFTASLLLYFYLRNFLQKEKFAIFAAFLFAVHPIHSEAGVPAFGRAELLCFIFIIAGFICHRQVRGKIFPAIFAGIFSLFALWSKENALIFIPLCFLHDWYERKIVLNRNFLTKYSVYLCFFCGYLILKYFSAGYVFPDLGRNFEPAIDNVIAAQAFPMRFLSAAVVQGLAVYKIIFPAHLSHDYSFAQILPVYGFNDLRLIAVLGIGALVLSCLFFLLSARRRLLLFLFFSYLVSVIPVCNFFVPSGTIFGERLMYLPSLWIIVLLSLILFETLRNSRARFIICAAIIVVCIVRSNIRTRDWENDMSLAIAGVKSSPKSTKIWCNMAVQFAERGDYVSAIAASDKALEIYPNYAAALANRGYCKIMLGDIDGAEADLRKALGIHRRYLPALHNLGSLLANTGRKTEAMEVWGEALKIKPDHPEILKKFRQLKDELDIPP
jgi:tetratricopeptide (TPR) repeat protein